MHQTQKEFLTNKSLYRGFVGGRGAGKSWIGSYDLLRRAKRDRLYMVVSPTYTMLSDSSFRSFKEHLETLVDARFTVNRSSFRVTLPNNAEVIFRSADNPDRLRGPNLSGVWLDEASLMHQDTYDICIASLREKGEAGWLSATFTPKGVGHWTYQVFATDKPNTSLIRSPTASNCFLDDAFIDAIKSQYSDRTALQELEGEFVDTEGAEWPASHFGDHIWFSEWPKCVIKTIALDPSKGSGAKHGDFSAFAVLGRGTDGILYCEAFMDRINSEQIVDMTIELQRRFQADNVVIETNQFQELLATQIVTKSRQADIALPVTQVINSVNKEVRIRRLGPYLANRGIRFKAESKGTKLLVDQLRDFPVAQHDDGPDSLEMALRAMIELWNGKNTRTPKRLLA